MLSTAYSYSDFCGYEAQNPLAYNLPKLWYNSHDKKSANPDQQTTHSGVIYYKSTEG